jgi:hypothetical protein
MAVVYVDRLDDSPLEGATLTSGLPGRSCPIHEAVFFAMVDELAGDGARIPS